MGDIMLSSWLVEVLEREGPDYPYAGIAPLLAGTDLLIGNLEAPFLADTTGVVRAEKSYTFAVPPERVDVLEAGGFGAVTLANNHILDFGLPGLEGTWLALEGAGIPHAGTGRDREEAHTHTLVEAAGHRVALLAYNHVFPAAFWADGRRPGTAHASDAGLAREVRRAAADADLVVVSFHWSAEGLEEPKGYQRILARIAVDSGADLVVGHHPHVLQTLEWYRGRLIAYSLGNFLFASYSPAAAGALLVVRFAGSEPVDAAFHPLDVNNIRREFRPSPVLPEGWGELGSGVVDALADSAASGASGVEVMPEGWLLLRPPGDSF
ncbi:MAG: CapA family protein [bacterium]